MAFGRLYFIICWGLFSENLRTHPLQFYWYLHEPKNCTIKRLRRFNIHLGRVISSHPKSYTCGERVLGFAIKSKQHSKIVRCRLPPSRYLFDEIIYNITFLASLHPRRHNGPFRLVFHRKTAPALNRATALV